jgi:choline/glycine/proline betaine transport protein
MQLNEGLNIVTGDFKVSTSNQVIIIIVVTCIATISVLTGIKNGIRRLAEFTFLLGNILLLVVFFMDDWKYCLNSLVEVTF